METAVRDKAGRYVGYDCADGALMATFEGKKNPFACSVLVCDNPGCGNAHVTFTERVEVGEEAGGKFSASMDPATGDLRTVPDDPPEVLALLEEFNRDLTPEARAFLVRRVESAREQSRQAARFAMTAAEVRRGSTDAYWDVFHSSEIAPDPETPDAFLVYSGGLAHVIDDEYCLSPDCDCLAAYLSVYRQPRAAAPVDDLFLFSARTDLNGRPTEFLDCIIPEAEAADILSVWRAGEPDLPEVLATRYKRMKAFGARTNFEAPEKPPERPRSPGRNDPCPCGSGRKYKKCCLPRDEKTFREPPGS